MATLRAWYRRSVRRDPVVKICVNERHARDDASRKAEVETARLQFIKDRALELRSKEKGRLATSIVPSIEELRQLTPQRFEDEMAQLFRRLGYDVQQTPYSNDGGRDALMRKNGEKFLLECKRYGERTLSGRPDIQKKFHSAIISDQAKEGFFVTSGSFQQGRTGIFQERSRQADRRARSLFASSCSKSKPPSSGDDTYASMCQQCGDVVKHRLRIRETVRCRNGHDVPSTLKLGDVLGGATHPTESCKCGAPMRLIDGRRGKFWGCSSYPTCRSTRSVKSSARRRHNAWRPAFNISS